jgi:large subunit ribosomal protein L32
MAVPQKKTSIFRKHRRHSTRQTINLKRLTKSFAITKCSNCGATKLAHRVCESCGRYGGKQVMTITTSSKDQVLDA